MIPLPKVSVIVPIYNVSRYLRQCLDSLVHQTLKDIEIICVDDGSTDESGIIVDEYANKYSQIKVIHKKNTGYGHSMNVGIKNASGKYIGIVESDDYAEETMFEYLLDKALATKADIVKSNYWEYGYGENDYYEALKPCKYDTVFSPLENNYSVLYCPQSIWSAVYKKDFLIENGIYFNETPGASYQDVSFSFKSLISAKRVLLVKNAFLHYRIDNCNSSVKAKDKVYCILNEIKNIEEFIHHNKMANPTGLYLFAPLKYRLLYENYQRIADNFKVEFLNIAINEMKATEVSGNIHPEYWQQDVLEKAQSMIHTPNKFIFDACNRLVKKRLLRLGFEKKIKCYDKIYLYGAGQVARRMIMAFKDADIALAGCLVTKIKDNVNYLFDVQVKEYKQENLNKENDLIIIALKQEYQYEVLPKLLQDGFMHIIPLDMSMREMIEEL